MPVLGVTLADVPTFAPDAPPVTADQLQEAGDWAEPLLAAAGVTLVPESAQARAAQRAVMAYAVSLAMTGTVTGAALDASRVVKLKDGAEEITFADRDPAVIAALPGAWLSRAWTYLIAAGVPRPRRGVVGVSR